MSNEDSNDQEDIKNDTLDKYDMVPIITSIINKNDLMGHNINSFNDFLEYGIQYIMRELYNIDKTTDNKYKGTTARERAITSYTIKMKFSDILIDTPKYTSHYKEKSNEANVSNKLYPYEARKNNLPYSGEIKMNVKVTIIANGINEQKEFDINNISVGNIPIMIKSLKCNTIMCATSTLKEIKEDPIDKGGQFIAKGSEWVIDLTENIKYNSPHNYINIVASERIRCEFLSQPGGAFESSSLIRIRYMENGRLTIEIKSNKLKVCQLPFFVIYKLFDMRSDLDVTKTIVNDINSKDPITTFILNALETAFHNYDTKQFTPQEINNPELLLLKCADILSLSKLSKSYETDENAKKYVINKLMNDLDAVFLQHMGQKRESRVRKLMFLGLLIHKVFLVHLNILAPSDRDNLSNKRAHGAGISLAKAFKAQINNNFVSYAIKILIKELETNSFDSIDQKLIEKSIRNSAKGHDLSKAMEQSITTSSKEITQNNKTAVNRVSSQQLERKNPLNTLSALRTLTGIATSNKTTTRADEMRRVHPSYTGYICVVQSADSGEKVGLKKQLAITTTICTAGEAPILKKRLLESESVISLDKMIIENIKNYNNIFINGEWIGCCKSAYALQQEYIKLRRNSQIDKYTTIYVDPITTELHFWLDVGRLIRPLLIVYNNIEDYDNGKDSEFRQWTKLTKKHIMGIYNETITFDDLINEQIMEYLAPDEVENMLLSPSIENLNKNCNNVLMQYTHCDIEQAILGLAALISPYGNHTKTDRITMATNHMRQAAGVYCYNYPHRYDKNRFVQFINEIPIVNTMINKYIPPCGMNCLVAYSNYLGENQEDSVVVNKSSSDRGLFSGLFFRVEKIPLEQNHYFRIPDQVTTINYKKSANYSKLGENGLITQGSIVNTGDIIIGMVEKTIKGNESNIEDKSIPYNITEQAIVVESCIVRGADDESIAIVKLEYYRKLVVGDKLSSRSGNKSIVARVVKQSDIPFTEDGLQPDLIINPLSFPSRMAIGQLMESLQAMLAVKFGSTIDGTTFMDFNPNTMFEELVKNGMRCNGKSTMRNGITGEIIDSAISLNITYEVRLQKFVIDDEQFVGKITPRDPITGQPNGGKQINGGLKLCEMEAHCLISHGCMEIFHEKYSIDSDGMKLYICRSCKNPAVYNASQHIYKCNLCKEYADIVGVDSCKAAIAEIEYINGTGINAELSIEPLLF